MFDAKRLIGRKFDEPCVQSDAKLWPFKIENKGGKPVISVDYKGENKTFMPEEVSSMVLIKMKEIAEAYLGMYLGVLRCFHFIQTTRVHLTMPWVVLYSISSEFGPFP